MDAVKAFGDKYGPYGFGIASLLLIWFCIVAPQLQANKMDYSEQTKILEGMKEIASQQRTITEGLAKAVFAIEKLLDRQQQHEHASQ